VTLLLRPETLVIHPDTLHLESPFGSITAPITRGAILARDVDVLWVTVKATQLERALSSVPNQALAGTVVPLLNGVDHVALLRERCGARVVAATIACEAERLAPGRIAHTSPFARLVFHRPTVGAALVAARLDPSVEALEAFGCVCSFDADETTLLWRKLVMLCPFALRRGRVDHPGGLRQVSSLDAKLDAEGPRRGPASRARRHRRSGHPRRRPAGHRGSRDNLARGGGPGPAGSVGAPLVGMKKPPTTLGGFFFVALVCELLRPSAVDPCDAALDRGCTTR